MLADNFWVGRVRETRVKELHQECQVTKPRATSTPTLLHTFSPSIPHIRKGVTTCLWIARERRECRRRQRFRSRKESHRWLSGERGHTISRGIAKTGPLVNICDFLWDWRDMVETGFRFPNSWAPGSPRRFAAMPRSSTSALRKAKRILHHSLCR